MAFKAESRGLVFATIESITPRHTLMFDELPAALLHGEIIRGQDIKAHVAEMDSSTPFQSTDYICPIRVTDTLAALMVFSPEEDRRLSPEEMRLLKSLLHQCDVLMENMKLYQSLQQKMVSISQLKEYNENIIESSRIGILSTDEMGKAVSVNNAMAELAGMSKGGILGKTFDQLLRGSNVKTQRQLKSGFAMEGKFINQKDQMLILKIERTPLRTRDNEVYGTLYLVEDIREKKAFDEKIMQQEKLASIGLLAAGVAHEINTPLTGIASYSQLLIRDPELHEEQKELLELIRAQSHRAANIVTDLLRFSRKESAPKGPVDLREVLKQTLRFLSHQIQKRQVRIIIIEPTGEAIIEGYDNQIQQVYVNLIVNAMDAMPGGGDLEIGIRKGHGQHDMWFQDSGVGMDDQTRSHIFDPFFTTKEAGKGTGLGLSVVYQILRDHEATVEVTSEAGKGTRFSLSFPNGKRGKIAS